MNKTKSISDVLPIRYVNAKGAADFLGVSVNFLYKLTSSHRIPYYKPCGKRIFFRKSELD